MWLDTVLKGILGQTPAFYCPPALCCQWLVNAGALPRRNQLCLLLQWPSPEMTFQGLEQANSSPVRSKVGC